MTRVTVGGGSSVRRTGSIRTDGVWVHKGDWDGSTDAFPNGAKKGYAYFNTANRTNLLMPDGGIIPSGTYIVAKIDNPATVNDWMFFSSVV